MSHFLYFLLVCILLVSALLRNKLILYRVAHLAIHWLPVEHRIKYKVCTLMHQIHTMRAPQYLAHSVRSVAESSRRPGLRSTNSADYIKRRTPTKFGERCCSYAGPAAWNSIPDSIKLTTDSNRLKRT